MNTLYTNSLSNQSIAAYLEVGSYTATADCQVMIRVILDQVAGNGDYYAYATIDSAVFGPITKFAVPNAVTKIGFVAGVQVPLLSGETLKIFVKGLPADTVTPDIVVKMVELGYSVAGDEMDLVDAPNSTAITAFDTALTAAHGSGSWQRSSGAGTIAFTYTVTESVGGAPIPDVSVYFYSDAGGTTLMGSGITNAFGDVIIHLNAGTYYIWCYKTGYSFSNPDTEIVS